MTNVIKFIFVPKKYKTHKQNLKPPILVFYPNDLSMCGWSFTKEMSIVNDLDVFFFYISYNVIMNGSS